MNEQGRSRMRAAVRFLLTILSIALCGGCASALWKRDNPYAESSNDRYEVIDLKNPSASGSVQTASYEDKNKKSNDSSFQVKDLAPGNLSQSVKKLTGKGPKQDLARKYYQEADAQFRKAMAAREQGEPHQKLFLEAGEKYKKAADRWPKSALEQDAMFMMGECYFFADRYPKANDAYGKLIKKYPNTRHLDTVDRRRFALARYWLELKPLAWYRYNVRDPSRPARSAFSNGVRTMDRIRFDNPTGRLADDATLAAGHAHFQNGNYNKADDFFEDLRKTFPTSEHQFLAHVFGVRTKLESYRGSSYDGDPLGEAEKLIEQIRRQFPQKANEEPYREQLSKASKLIRLKKAEREIKMAEYYDGRGEYRGARYYYNILARDYSDTPYGQQAEKRLAQISDKPDKPPQRLGWLINLFPDSNDEKPLIISDDATSVLR